MIYTSITAVLSAIFYAWLNIYSCGTRQVVGVTHPYPTVFSDFEPELIADCNVDCHCTPEFMEPVCLNNQTYFSPCHAGCTQESINGTIAGCGCAADQIAFEGYCPNPDQQKCDDDFDIMLILVFLTIFFEFMSDTTVPIAILRAVNPEFKGLSMGLYWIIVKLFGYIPSPLIGGALIDGACTVWKQSCEGVGFCWLYDDDKMFSAIMWAPMITKGINIIFFLLAAYYFIPIPIDDTNKDNLRVSESKVQPENESGENGKALEEVSNTNL